MSDAPKDDETKFNETLKRMLESPPKPHRKEAQMEKGSTVRPTSPVEDTAIK